MNNRIDILKSNMQTDAVFITSAVNRRYYTDFTSSAGMIFITKDVSYFIIDFRYIQKAKQVVKDCEVILQEDNFYDQLNALIKTHNVKSVSVESGYITLQSYLKYKEKLVGIEVVMDNSLNEIIIKQRQIKTANEIENIKEAQRITDAAFSHILNYIKVGKTENEVALELELYVRNNGASGVSFDYIVVSGMNSSLPHGSPTDKKIEAGDMLTMDFGAVVNGYMSDMTRTIVISHINDEQGKIYNTVLESQLKSLKAIKPGISTSEVDKIARDYIAQAGYGECFGHGLGHSVGIEIHEEPAFSKINKDTCKSGMIMTVEPGIYLDGKFGCRIEDMVLITDNGYENFTKSKKELIIL